MDTVDGLIAVALDLSASDSERDDAVMDLSKYDTPRVESVLVSLGGSREKVRIVRASAGESLGEIYQRRIEAMRSSIRSLADDAHSEARGVFRNSLAQLLAECESSANS